ncbi:HAMP domain-containing histidine kinase [bacterium]|nr:HAMP domain-containing histidine kinase [bacterium]
MTFRLKIFLLFASSAIIILLIAILAVNAQFQRFSEQQVQKEFSGISSRFEYFHHIEMDNLISLAVNISDAPRLRGSLATGDRATILQAAEQTNVNYLTDLFWVIQLDGTIVAKVDAPQDSGQVMNNLPVVQDVMKGFDSGDIWLMDNMLYQVSAVSIVSGDEQQGILLIGNDFDEGISNKFIRLTGLDIAFFNEESLISTSLPDTMEAKLKNVLDGLSVNQTFQEMDMPRIPDISDDTGSTEYPVQRFSLANIPYAGSFFSVVNVNGDELATGMIFRSLLQETQLLSRIQSTLIIVGLIGFTLALLAAYLLTKQITRPVDELVNSAEKLGEGDLETAIIPRANDEIGKLAVAMDETRKSLRATREELIRNEKLSTVGRMASMIIHDFRQPMSAINGYMELMVVDSISTEKRKKFAENITRQSDRMLSMINELLDFARGEIRLSRKTVSLARFLDEITHNFDHECRRNNICIKSDLFWDGEVTIDEGRLQRAVENIIRNAVQAIKTDGNIYLTAAQENGTLRIKIKDDGPGIDPEIRENLFKPFFSHGKSEGTGLGLAVVQRVIKEHGGQITVDSKVGEGTIFTISLPLTS